MPAKNLPQVNLVEFFRCEADDLAVVLAAGLAASRERSPKLKLNDHHLAILTWSALTNDLLNGGFVQFFHNHQDKGVSQLADLLDKVELPMLASALREATDVYKQNKRKFKVSDLWDELYKDIEEFSPHDKTFLQALKTFNRELETWVRKNIKQLATDESGADIQAEMTGTAESYHSNGQLKQSLAVKKGKPYGSYYEYFDDGSLRYSCYYQAGKVTNDFWPDGQAKRKENKKGELRITEWFYPDGKLQKRYVRGKEGIAEPIRVYHPNGQIAEELNFVKGDKRGPWLRFFPDGKPELQAKYVAKESLVVLNAWDETGKQVVKDGKGVFCNERDIDCAYDVYSEITYREVMELQEGIPHGKVSLYKRTGSLR